MERPGGWLAEWLDSVGGEGGWRADGTVGGMAMEQPSGWLADRMSRIGGRRMERLHGKG